MRNFEPLLDSMPVEEVSRARGNVASRLRGTQLFQDLVLGGSGDVSLDREIGEELRDFFFTHGVGVAFLVEKDVAANPIEVGLLGADAVMFHPQVPARAIEKLRSRRGNSRDKHFANLISERRRQASRNRRKEEE